MIIPVKVQARHSLFRAAVWATEPLGVVLRCWVYTSAGSGLSITVDPADKYDLLCRAEGDCNNTAAVSQLVTVRVPSTDPQV